MKPDIYIGIVGTSPEWRVFIQTDKTYITPTLDKFDVEYWFKQGVNNVISQTDFDQFLNISNFTLTTELPTEISTRVVGVDWNCSNFYKCKLQKQKLTHQLKQSGPRWIVIQSMMIDIGNNIDFMEYEEPK